MFFIEKVLKLVRKTKAKTAAKKACKQPLKCSNPEILDAEEDEVLKDENNSSDFVCIVLRPRK